MNIHVQLHPKLKLVLLLALVVVIALLVAKAGGAHTLGFFDGDG